MAAPFHIMAHHEVYCDFTSWLTTFASTADPLRIPTHFQDQGVESRFYSVAVDSVAESGIAGAMPTEQRLRINADDLRIYAISRRPDP